VNDKSRDAENDGPGRLHYALPRSRSHLPGLAVGTTQNQSQKERHAQ
jgi:hypothetical protein